MTIEPTCPRCGRAMRFFVIEEADKASHFECLDCAKEEEVIQADRPTTTVAVPEVQRVQPDNYKSGSALDETPGPPLAAA